MRGVDWLAAIAILSLLNGCGGNDEGNTNVSPPAVITPTPDPIPDPTPPTTPTSPTEPPFAANPFNSTPIATLEWPWAIALLPDGRILVSERTEPTGQLKLVTQTGTVTDVTLSGLPQNIGLLDVVLDPDYASNHYVYISLREVDPAAPRFGRDSADLTIAPQGLTVVRGVLDLSGPTPALMHATILFQATKVVSYPGPNGEFGGRLLFSQDHVHLFITTGDRQEFEPCQDLSNTICKLIRINKDGSIPFDNPFVSDPSAKPEIYTLGNRNAYGLAYDTNGLLWSNEQGPEGGDEFNLVVAGANYGWPNVSNGRNYGIAFDDIPDHSPGDGYYAPTISWTPVIAPSGLIFYTGTLFEAYTGDAFIPGLKSQAIVRVHVSGTSATEVERYSLGTRVRALAQGPDGVLWALEDGTSGRLLRLTPL